MGESTGPDAAPSPVDIGEYCRAVEAHLTRVNEGDLVRLVGPGFEIVRGWAIEGIPLSLVFHGITAKAERHRTGSARRPLRAEFCEGDVRATYEHWRRAVGLTRVSSGVPDAEAAAEAEPARTKPSLVKHLDRVIDRLSRAAGRLDLPESLRAAIADALESSTAVRERAKAARGAARAELASELPGIDATLVAAARRSAAGEPLRRLERQAEDDLAPYRSRLSPEAWDRSITLGVERLLRDASALPDIVFDP